MEPCGDLAENFCHVTGPFQSCSISIRSDEGLTIEMSAFESLYGGQFTLSTQLIKPNYLVILPTDATPQLFQKLTPFIRMFHFSLCSLFRYGGLLLYFCRRSVSAAFLAQFKFAPRSRLCLVCQDRNTLRQEVARLDLEEHWRFRLRDEFQTANSPDEPSLYFLTGKHDD